jgi:uncharacterized repeat protein (TIGR01451 family)
VVHFDPSQGLLSIAVGSAAHAAHVSENSAGNLLVSVDGKAYAGAPALSVRQISMSGAGALDTLFLDGDTTPASLAISSDGALDVTGAISTGGTLQLQSGSLINTGQLRAGRAVKITAGSVLQAGLIGGGASAAIVFSDSYTATQPSRVLAGGTGNSVTITGGRTGRLFSSGTDTAAGGSIGLFGRTITLVGATLDVSGSSAGGTVFVGGFGRGAARGGQAAQTVSVDSSTVIRASALSNGNGGRVIAWANQTTSFGAAVAARGGPGGGDGGTVEVSAGATLSFTGTADVAAPRGRAGHLLLDPANVVIGGPPAGVYPQFNLVDPNATTGGNFGASVAALPSGNLVVTAPNDTVNGVTNAGAVYLYDGLTGALISALTGTTANDQVGSAGTGVDAVVVLKNGNYVVVSGGWNGGAGAVTFGSGSTGLSGSVTAGNSLVGSAAADRVGVSGGAVDVVALSNGNYVVGSPARTNGTAAGAGAATFGGGTTGVAGTITSTNSLVGTQTGDGVGQVITPLTSGNYVVGSPAWANGGATGAGAATFGNGTTGVNGLITSANSLVGSQTSDGVGGSVTALTNGSYVVVSSKWANASTSEAGAATFGDGTHGVSGLITSANSLVGSAAGDQVGSGGVTALKNGSYVVASPLWANASVPRAGAATPGSSAQGISGLVTSSNSLVGVTAGDEVGTTVVALTNGNYVVGSPLWNNGSLAQAGAATFGSGSQGVTGTVTLANSLVGTHANDQVGQVITALTNGNYVVGNPAWSNGSSAHVGAATFGDGLKGIAGAVSAANSLVGSSANDAVGGAATALSNGNYVVVSPFWNNGAATQGGAVTFGAGTKGITGTVSAGNSLVGRHAGDLVGVIAVQGLSGTTYNNAVVALTNGNYVVASPNWNNGTTTQVGAVTFGNGTTGTTGAVAAGNSLVGSTAGDEVGRLGAIALTDGNYLVGSPLWSNGGLAGAGAATFVNGTTGQTLDEAGAITAQNSIVGGLAGDFLAPTADDQTNDSFVAVGTGGDGQVSIGLTNPNQLTPDRDQGQTITVTPAFLNDTLDAGTAIIIQTGADITVSGSIAASAGGHGGDLTLHAGGNILLNAGIATDGGGLTLIGTISPRSGPVTLAAPTTFDTTSTFAVDITVTSGQAQANAVNVTGVLNLNNSTLRISNPGGVPLGVPLVIATATGGFGGSQFSGLPEGSTVSAGGQTLRVSYRNNEVTLTVVQAPLVWTGANSGLWNDPGNWNLNQVPQNGMDLVFPQSASHHATTDNVPGLTLLDSFTITGQADPSNPYRIDPGSVTVGAAGLADLSTPAAGGTTVDAFLASVNVTNTLRLSSVGTPVNVASAGVELDVASGLAGSGSFTTTGAGTLRLVEGSADTASVGGPVVIAGGTLVADAAGFTAPSVEVQSGTTLTGGGVVIAAVTADAGADLAGGGTPAGTTTRQPDLNVLGPVTFAPGSTLTVMTGFGSSDFYSGVLASGPVTVQPGAQFLLQVPNGFTAPTTAHTTQTVVFSAADFSGTFDRLPNASVLTVNNQRFRVNNFAGASGGITLTYLGKAPAGPQVDLTISVDDGSGSVFAGQKDTYTIVVTNTSGQTRVTGAAVADAFPGALQGVTWTAVASAGSSVAKASGSGNIGTTVTLAPGGTATFTVHATVADNAASPLSETATVTAPPGVVDPDTGNNTATDADTVAAPAVDLSITETDSGNASAVPGRGLTYTIVVRNNDATLQALGAAVTDMLPAGLVHGTWTARASAGSSVARARGTTGIGTTVNLAPLGTVTFTLHATVAAAATGTLSNAPVVSVPTGFTDPDPSNNTATDPVTLKPQADLAVSMKADTVRAGEALTFVVAVTNKGPSAATNVTLADLVSGIGGTFRAAVSQGTLTVSNGVVTGHLGTIGSGATATLVIVVNTTLAGGITSVAQAASADVPDPNTKNNSTSLTATVLPPLVLTPWIKQLLIFPYHLG